MNSASVHPEQRFTSNCPCPVCRGHAQLPHGQGVRCWGFLSANGEWAHCTREEFAGSLAEGSDGAYAHRLDGDCRCGRPHGTPHTRDVTATNLPRAAVGAVVAMRKFSVIDADGREVAIHHRVDRQLPDGQREKDIWWEPRGVHPAEMPLYGLPALLNAAPDGPVVVTEGEPACDALQERGTLVVATVTGASIIPCDDSLRPLIGRKVILWPDNDNAGRKHMRGIAARLLALGPVDVRVVEWPDAPHKGDAADFVGTDDELRALIDGALPWTLVDDSEPARDRTDFPTTDLGNAELFAYVYGDHVRFDHKRQRWLLFRDNDHQWRPDRDGELARLAKATARERLRRAADIDDTKLRNAAVRFARQSESRQRLDAIIALARSEHPIADDGENWNSDPMLLGVAGGVLALHSGDFRPGRPEDRLTLSTGIPYEPDAPCPRWIQFLEEVFEGDEALIGYVRRTAGYCLTGDTSEQSFTLAYGTGSNGKSVFLNVLRRMVGEYALNLPFSTFELRDRSALTPDLAMLPGKRLVTSSETNDGTRLNEARLKALTGGDPVTANPKFVAPFTFQPVAKFLLAVNHLPTVRDDSDAFWRRVHVLPFSHKFSGADIDKHLEQKLMAELPGILAWAVRGAVEWARDGLCPPDAVLRRARAWREESDSLAPFFADRCILVEHARVGAGDLYKAYVGWCADMAMPERERLSNKKFGQLMFSRFERKETRRGRSYVAIGLRDEDHSVVEGHLSGTPSTPSTSRTPEAFTPESMELLADSGGGSEGQTQMRTEDGPHIASESGHPPPPSTLHPDEPRTRRRDD